MTPRPKSPKRFEYAVLGVFSSAFLIGLGGFALVVAAMTAPHYSLPASRVMLFGFISMGLGVTMALLFWVYDRLTGR
jgi:hypothetical protein